MRFTFNRVLWIGPIAFGLTACAWSVLDVQFSTDTWLGLAGGRQLMERIDWSRLHETFPRLDTFSYTFYGKPWLNQNWLTYLGQYWLYDRIGQSAVVYATWVLAACILVLVALAVYWRTQSWLAACLAAALVGIGARDFLEPRAAVVGLLCVAALWGLLCAIEGQRSARRWWPIVVLLPLLVFWSNAHGGFVFGYGMLALYIGHWGLSSVRRTAVAANAKQIIAICAVLIAAIAASIVISPFGVENIWQPRKIAAGTTFRIVSEWQPAYSHIGTAFPPMWRFWTMLGLWVVALPLLWGIGRIYAEPDPSSATRRAAPDWSLYDVALVIISLGMTLWARRFAPLFYVLAAPVLAIWTVRLAAPLGARIREGGVLALKIAAALAALVTGALTWSVIQIELIDAYRDQPGVGLLERARGYASMHEAVRFLGENQLRVSLFAEYGDGCSTMFHAPLARVFVDGRAEQLYSEEHFKRYQALMHPRMPAHHVRQVFDATGTDAVLVRRTDRLKTLRNALEASPEWVLVLINAEQTLFLRRGSRALERLGMLIRNDREWRPARAGTITPSSQASQAVVILNTSPAEPANALGLLRKAVEREMVLGLTFYPVIVRLTADTAGPLAAADYVALESTRITHSPGLDDAIRPALLAALARARSP